MLHQYRTGPASLALRAYQKATNQPKIGLLLPQSTARKLVTKGNENLIGAEMEAHYRLFANQSATKGRNEDAK